MQGKIGLEEHFAVEETLADSAAFAPERCWVELSKRLIDVQNDRVAAMDAHGNRPPNSQAKPQMQSNLQARNSAKPQGNAPKAKRPAGNHGPKEPREHQ